MCICILLIITNVSGYCIQERSYNPYYTLIGQHLCRQSHNHKITLQYCLWDFLRDLGETNGGGAEIIKNLRDDDVGCDVKSISSTRMSNLARAFGWWIAKDCVTLAILKVISQDVLHSFLNSYEVFASLSSLLYSNLNPESSSSS